MLDSLEITPEKINNAITDRIPERPVGVVEGTSYSIIIAAAIAVRCTCAWAPFCVMRACLRA
jgi:hypothetical protein